MPSAPTNFFQPSHHPLQWAMTLTQEKGASNGLTTLQITEFSFALHKGPFWDALAL